MWPFVNTLEAWPAQSLEPPQLSRAAFVVCACAWAPLKAGSTTSQHATNKQTQFNLPTQQHNQTLISDHPFSPSSASRQLDGCCLSTVVTPCEAYVFSMRRQSSSSSKRSSILLCQLLLLSVAVCCVLAGESNHRYKDSEEVVLWVNKVGPYNNPQVGDSLQSSRRRRAGGCCCAAEVAVLSRRGGCTLARVRRTTNQPAASCSCNSITRTHSSSMWLVAGPCQRHRSASAQHSRRVVSWWSPPSLRFALFRTHTVRSSTAAVATSSKDNNTRTRTCCWRVQETYNYYYLPFCKHKPQEKVEHAWGGLGEVLQGNELINSQLDIKFKGE